MSTFPLSMIKSVIQACNEYLNIGCFMLRNAITEVSAHFTVQQKNEMAGAEFASLYQGKGIASRDALHIQNPFDHYTFSEVLEHETECGVRTCSLSFPVTRYKAIFHALLK